ncbi:MAG: hypothetical protein WBG37_18070 [Desulfobacterales bacterium]|jgi:hypothetical protein
MPGVVELLRMAAALGTGALLGNWFLKEVRRARNAGKPWHAPYKTVPGILVLLALIILPLLYWRLGF